MTNKPMLSIERELRSAVEQALLAMKRIYQAGYDSIIAAGGSCDQPGCMIENDPTARELRALLDKHPHMQQKGYDEAMGKVGALLDKPSTCAESQVEPSAQHQGEPVLQWSDDNGVSWCDGNERSLQSAREAGWKTRTLYAELPAPVAVMMPFAEKVISKLRRFEECASDDQDVDIGRHWFDLLTQLGLLSRVQRSPAFWEMTQQGEDALEVTRLNIPR